MAVVLPVLRLFLLFLNLYGTFKAMKPPPVSQRSTRNGQGTSVRAMQLRKRELKSRLAVWVVWAIFSTLERPLDHTLGFVTPFYNEIKCTVLLFLVVTRSHGAEAIFLHLIHPLLRPYVPAVDNILATLRSIFDLITLLIFLPWEYILHWWRHWDWSLIWTKDADKPSGGDCSSSDSDSENTEDDQRRLRPRHGSRQEAWMKEANRQAQVVLQELDGAQDRVRTRARGQFTARNNAQPRPIRETRNTHPNSIGLRTRKRVLDYSNDLPDEASRLPGSRSTGVHHLDLTTVSQLAQGPASQRFPAFPNAPDTQPVPQPVFRPSSPIRVPTPSSSSQSGHEIWYPPQSAFEGPQRRWTPSGTAPRTPPSPIYPPLPSAYQFTPRRSDPLPPLPHIVTPPDVATPTPRRVSTGAMTRGAFDAYDGIDQFPGRSSQAGPAKNAHSMETLPDFQKSEDKPVGPEDSFRQALELSIQAMDVDTATLSMRDGSSASEEFIEDGESNSAQRNAAKSSARYTRGGHGGIRESYSKGRTNRRAPTKPVRRSARTTRNDMSSVETDEFGFTIRQELKSLAHDASSLSALGTESLAVSLSGPKPLARTKPSLKTTQEEGLLTESSDEESVKKRRKLKPDVEGQSSSSGDIKVKSGKARRKATVRGTARRIDISNEVLKDLQVETRATRASTRQPLSRQSHGRAIKKDKGK